ncbi:hypothetical protein LJB77_02120 [Ruminococcaceae bacterium OttesenSCG-928-N02]|nr:hypothetical protein [Ruminococcaceae bacterium OttesenSCG-928-N02]
MVFGSGPKSVHHTFANTNFGITEDAFRLGPYTGPLKGGAKAEHHDREIQGKSPNFPFKRFFQSRRVKNVFFSIKIAF